MKVLKTGMLMAGAMLVAAFMASAPAAAQSWSGCYVTGAAGAGFAQTELTIFGTSLDGLGQQGIAARGGAECILHSQQAGLAFIVGADYGWTNSEINLAGLTAGLDKGWDVYGGIGIPKGDKLFYAIAGFEQRDWDNNFGVKMDKLKGWFVGAGMSWQASKALAIGPEYRFVDYRAQDFGPIKADTDRHEIMLVVKGNLTEMFK